MIALPKAIIHAQNLRHALEQQFYNVSLKVLEQGLVQPNALDTQLLNTTNAIYKRQVHILADTVPIIFASTIMSEQTYKNYHTQLKDLGNKFIGDNFLYQSQFIRSPFEFSYTNNSTTRKSEFTLQKDRIILIENFLIKIY